MIISDSSYCVSFLLIALASSLISSGSSSVVSRQTKADVCPNVENNACLFAFCDNGGTCMEDSTTVECYRCQCPAGYTGKLCESLAVVSPTGCNPACINGGTCNNNVCYCPLGFFGSYCEQKDYCQPNTPCLNRGQCYPTANSFVCDCSNTGFTGPTCAEPIVTDPCTSFACLNGGTCLANGASPICLCANGYAGSNCQIAPIPCVVTPCENGGTCQLIAPDTYGCKCPATFTGTRCETSIVANHVCVLNPAAVCQNGGTCIINNADYICKCATGWTGTNCQTRDASSTCNPSPCGAHGSCSEIPVQGGQVAFCTCADRWTGRYCDISLDTGCPVGFCLSGGTCRMAGSTPYCDCPVGFTGQRCEITVTSLTTTTTAAPAFNPCSPNPCANGGTCYASGNSYICRCVYPWTEPTCTTLQFSTTTTATTTTTAPGTFNPCSPNPCANGGTCYASGNSYICRCVYPWTEPTCTTLQFSTTTTTTTASVTRPCSSNPCRNNGVCNEIGNTFTCSCVSPWTGVTCESFQFTTTTTVAPVVRPCASNPCLNGGQCYNNGNAFFCMCQSPWSGATCSSITTITTTTVAPVSRLCASRPCLNGGTCIETGNTYYCTCPPAWIGPICAIYQLTMTTTVATSSNPCASNPCRNGGTCFNNGNSFICVCSSPWSGSTCTTPGTTIITTTPSTAQCPLNCSPGVCKLSGNAQSPYICECNGVLRPNSCL